MMLAEIQADVLLRSLLIALVVVAPLALYKWRKLRRQREERLDTAGGADAADAVGAAAGPELSEVIERIDRLGEESRDGATPSSFTIPTGVRVDGADAPPALVDALVRDALRRSGLVATAELDTPRGRVVEVARWGHVEHPHGSGTDRSDDHRDR